MGMDTIGLLRPNTTEKEIVEYLETEFKEVVSFIEKRNGVSYFSGFIKFKDGEEERMLFYISEGSDKYKVDDLTIEKYTYLSMGMWGNSVSIIKRLCEYFGGAIDENDCDDKGFHFINKEKFSQGVELTLEKELAMTLTREYFKKVTEILNKYGIKL